MRRATIPARRPASIPFLALTFALAATAAVVFPPKAEAAIHLGNANTASLANGLVGYWPLDGATTNWATGQTGDLSSQGNSMTAHNLATSTSPVAGKIGQAITFNGVNQSFTKTSMPAITTGKITVAAWIKSRDVTKAYSRFVVADDGAAEETPFVLDFNGGTTKPRLRIKNPSDIGIEVDAVTTLSNNIWYFVVGTYDGIAARFYINGVLDASTFTTDSLKSAAYNVGIGSDVAVNADAYAFNGTIDDVRIYNRALSAAEVQQLYRLGTANAAHSNATSISNGLVGYWTMDGKDTDWATGKSRDLSGGGNDGQIISMSTSTSPVAGKIGQALKFDGSSNKVDFVPTSTMEPAQISISEWIYFTGTGSTDSVIGYTGSHAIEIDFLAGNKQISVGINQFACTVNSGVGALPANSWQHATVTFDGSTVQMYVNGALVKSASCAQSLDYTGVTNFDLSGAAGGVARLDDVRMYNRVLSASEVQQLYHLGTANAGHSNAGGSALSNGLVGYWTFDGSATNWRTNTTQDLSGNGNVGHLYGMATSSSGASGKIGQALNFTGLDYGSACNTECSYVLVDDASAMQPSQITLSAWVYNYTYSYGGIVAKGTGDVDNGYALYEGTAGQPYEFRLDYASLGGVIATLNKWQLVSGTYDGAMMKLYVDGKLTGSLASTTLSTASIQKFTVGVRSTCVLPDCTDSWTPLVGKVDDVRVYNRALSDVEIQQLYTMGR